MSRDISRIGSIEEGRLPTLTTLFEQAELMEQTQICAGTWPTAGGPCSMMQIHVKVLCTELFDERSGVKWRFKGDEPPCFPLLESCSLPQMPTFDHPCSSLFYFKEPCQHRISALTKASCSTGHVRTELSCGGHSAPRETVHGAWLFAGASHLGSEKRQLWEGI